MRFEGLRDRAGALLAVAQIYVHTDACARCECKLTLRFEDLHDDDEQTAVHPFQAHSPALEHVHAYQTLIVHALITQMARMYVDVITVIPKRNSN